MKDFNDIRNKYPKLFEGTSELEPFNLFGFECNTGWYDIIDKLCYMLYRDYRRGSQELERLKQNLENFKGYVARQRVYGNTETEDTLRLKLESSIAGLSAEVEEQLKSLPRFTQVKEKYGTLRVYMDNTSSSDNELITYAELMSECTCEECGNSGRTYMLGWHKTLCVQHAVARYGEKEVTEYKNNE
jgi:hypothetical protein